MNLGNDITLGILLVSALATWRISNLLMFESGPFNALEIMRKWLGVKEAYDPDKLWTGFISGLFSCMYCLSVWVGLSLAYLTNQPLYAGLGYSAVAVLIEHHLTKREPN